MEIYRRKNIAIIYNAYNIQNADYIKEFLYLIGLCSIELEEISENTYKFSSNLLDKIPENIQLQNNNQKFYSIIDSIINQLNITDMEEIESYKYIAKIYAEENLYQLIKQEEIISKKDYDKLSQKYNSIINKKLMDKVRKWGIKETIPIQFAILNLAYYINTTAKKLEEPSLFTPESIIRICNTIINNSDNEYNIAAAIFLKSNILRIFMRNNIESYELLNLLKADNDVLFNKGICYMNTQNYKEAIHYFNLVMNNPKALYLKAVCEKNYNKDYHAINSLEQFINMLNIKIKGNNLFINEFILLFKAFKEIGDIYYKLHEETKALLYYLNAENIFNNCHQLINWRIYGIKNSNKISFLTDNIKKEIPISNVFKNLSIIYGNTIINTEKSEKYYKLEQEYNCTL